MKKFNLKIMSPTKKVFDGEIRQITFRTPEAMRGLLPDHIPFMAPLISHVMKIYYDDDKFDFFSVKEGYIKFINNDCIVITDESYNIKDISKDSLKKEEEYWEKIKIREMNDKIETKKAEIQLERLQQILKKKR